MRYNYFYEFYENLQDHDEFMLKDFYDTFLGHLKYDKENDVFIDPKQNIEYVDKSFFNTKFYQPKDLKSYTQDGCVTFSARPSFKYDNRYLYNYTFVNGNDIIAVFGAIQTGDTKIKIIEYNVFKDVVDNLNENNFLYVDCIPAFADFNPDIHIEIQAVESSNTNKNDDEFNKYNTLLVKQDGKTIETISNYNIDFNNAFSIINGLGNKYYEEYKKMQEEKSTSVK